MISLDDEAPFVRVVRVIQTARDRDAAIEILIAAERTHGIRQARDR